MNNQIYSYQRLHSTRYTFTSKGSSGEVLKAVEFNLFPIDDIFILSFGDIKTDGSIDDRAMSNNNDIPKIIATVVAIVNEFTSENQNSTIFFTGSSRVRTILYRRVLKTHFDSFTKNFIITALIENPTVFSECYFHPATNEEYFAFVIKRKL